MARGGPGEAGRQARGVTEAGSTTGGVGRGAEWRSVALPARLSPVRPRPLSVDCRPLPLSSRVPWLLRADSGRRAGPAAASAWCCGWWRGPAQGGAHGHGHARGGSRTARNVLVMRAGDRSLKWISGAGFAARLVGETIGWVMRLSPDRYDLGARDPDQGGHQKPRAVLRRREDVVDRGVVVAVYRQEPTTEKPQEPVRDWQPDALAELSRAALFSAQFQNWRTRSTRRWPPSGGWRSLSRAVSQMAASRSPRPNRSRKCSTTGCSTRFRKHARGAHDGSAGRKPRPPSAMTATLPARNADQASSSARRLSRNVDRE